MFVYIFNCLLISRVHVVLFKVEFPPSVFSIPEFGVVPCSALCYPLNFPKVGERHFKSFGRPSAKALEQQLPLQALREQLPLRGERVRRPDRRSQAFPSRK